MVTLVNPANKGAQKVYERETQPPSEALAFVVIYSIGLCLVAALAWAMVEVMSLDPSLGIVLFLLMGLTGTIAVGIGAADATPTRVEVALKNRHKRRAAHYRAQGEILDVPSEIIMMWRNALVEGNVRPDEEPLGQPENHFAFFAGLMVLHKARDGVNEQLQQRLTARIQEKINDEAAEVAAEVQFTLAAQQDAAQMEAEARDNYAQGLLDMDQ